MKSSGTVDAGGTKVLLRHPKERIVLSIKCYERKSLVYVAVVMFNTWKVCSCQCQGGLFAGGNELLHEAGSSKSGTEGYTS